jgi:large repetitive protein
MKKFIPALLLLFAGINQGWSQAPANDNCSSAISLGSLPTPAACPSGNGATTSVNGTTVNATASNPYPWIIGCSVGNNTQAPAMDVWYSFVATGTLLNVNLTSTFAAPNFALWTGPCGSQTAIDCGIGTNAGVLNMTIQPLTPGTTYYVQISGNTTSATGTFTLTLDNDLDCNNCLQVSSFTSAPNPVNGTYQPGQTVTFCFTVNSYTEVSQNWLHGIAWTFGPGWNMSTIVTSAPAQCPYDPPGPGNPANGTWGWYNSVTSSATGNTYGPGFFFEYAGDADNNPGNNYGDASNGNCTWTFCVTITANTVCVQGQSLDITVNTLADGESGSWTSLACTGDPNFTINANMGCCTAPTMTFTSPSCNGGTNGTATATPTSPGSPYNYVWQNSSGTFSTSTSNTPSTVTGLTAGTYTVAITDANGCVTSNTVTITQPAALANTSSQTNITCNGLTNGSATVVASGGTPGYTYSWAPTGGTAATATGLGAGTYTCTITDANGCPRTQSFTITQPTALANTSSQVNVLCNGALTGSATVVASGGTPGYTYSWAPSGGTAATATGLGAGTYTCTITDANGCARTQSFTITQPTALSNTSSQTNILCNGALTGSATVVVSGGTPGYTYSWAPSGGTAATATGLGAGTYTCTITDANGCTRTQSFTITQPAALANTSSQTNILCNGGLTGSATVVVSGGTPGYTYSWAPSGGTAATATGLGAGTYTCTITDANGCTRTQPFTITQPAALANTSSQTNILCNGGLTGSATVVVSGGTPGYTYSWAPSGGTAATATGLGAGTYTCTITDANGCTRTQSFTITQPAALANTSSQTNVTCNGALTGSATVVVSGGTLGYTYSWAPSGGTAATATGLGAGTYTCTITDANGCTRTQSFTITQPVAITNTNSQTNLLCNGATSGSAIVNVSGGTPGYSYLWAPSGGTAATASGLGAGTFTVTITDANGCTSTQSFTITQPAAIAAIPASTAATCGGNNGTASVIASGGTPGYTYSWAPLGGTASTATGLPAGTYTCTITDANGCTTTSIANVSNTGGPTVTLSASGNVSCFGANTGSATVNVTGGTGPYTYSWAPTGGTNATATNLIAGNYTCTVTDANGCVSNFSVAITEPTQLSGTTTSTLANCGGNNGTATVTASGGTSGYTYSWSSGGTATTENNLASGNYTCTITDANGCTATATVNIANSNGPAASIASSSNISCFGGTTGTATANATGGTSPYTYAWSSGGTSVTESGLGAGTYTVVITDANGCADSTTIVLTEPVQLTASSTTVDANCGANDGSATVSAAGGTAGYTYSWSSGGTAATENNLASGSYTCTITDANGCTTMEIANINNLNGPTVQVASSQDVLCFGDTSGTATVSASGGTGPYTYAWSPSGGTAATATGLPMGTFTCTVTDANGCLTATTVTLTEPTQLSISATSAPATCSANNGSATAVVTGGMPGYSYSWSSGGNAATENNLAAGTYTLTLTDANGCMSTQTVTVTQTTALTATASAANVACFGGTSGSATATPTSGTAPYTYVWSSGGTNATETGLAAGTYTVTVTDSAGCTGTQTITVTEPPVLAATSTSTDITCFGAGDGSASVTATGGTGPYTYSWSPSGGSNATANNLANGTFTCTITDANGCTSTQSVTISQPAQITSTATSTDVLCNGDATGTASVNASGGTGVFAYNWSPAGGSNSSATGLAAGTYTCAITDANGCTSTQTVTVTQPNALSASTNSGNACAGLPVNISATANGGVAPYTYAWDNGVTTAAQTVTVGITTTFTVTITDANGCTTTGTSTATIDPSPTASFTSNATNGFFDYTTGNLCFTDNSGGATTWLWDLNGNVNTQQSPCVTITAADTGTYCAQLLVANSAGCTDTTEVCFEIGHTDYFVPNVFTPNADGVNDVFFITNSGMQNLHCEIYDRWGVLIYEWDTTTGGWDGHTTSGNEATDGVYYFVVVMKDFSDKEIVEKGFVHLIRAQ